MWFVVTIMLSFNDMDGTLLREYISENKMILLSPHIIKYGIKLKGFEFYCESRQGQEV